MAIHHKPINEQVMVITGASSGIGLCTALLAVEEGAKVVLVARSQEVLDFLEVEINRLGGTALAITADVSHRDEIDKIVETTIETFGRIDTWVNDAGVSIYGRLDEVSEDDSRRLFDINFWGLVNCSLAALPYLRESKGALINIGSEVSEAIIPLQGMYSASKHAVKGFTDTLRIEEEQLDNSYVSITLIQPTAVNTPYPEHARNYMSREPVLPTPQIQPEQVARAILKAAVEGGRDIKIGAMASVNTFVSNIFPALSDKLAAMQSDRQQSSELPIHPQGTLYRPGGTGRITGLHH